MGSTVLLSPRTVIMAPGATDGRIDRALDWIQVPLHHGVVDLVAGPLLELSLQFGVGTIALGQHHHATGAGVQAMHDPCRSAGPLAARTIPNANDPPVTVGPCQPGLACAATPMGLSSTATSPS